MLIETEISREARVVSAQTSSGPVVPTTLVVSNITRPAPVTLVASVMRRDRAVVFVAEVVGGPTKAVVVSAIGRKARSFSQGGVFIVVRGGIADTSNLLMGDGTGNAVDSGVNVASLVTEFLELADTPSDYTGQGGKTVAVKSDASGLEFITPSGGGSGDVVGPGSAADSDFAQFDGTTGKLIKDGGLSLDTNTSLGTSDSKIPSQKAVKTYADQLIAAADAMIFKGVLDCSGNPNYPAADRGWTYRVSVAGKIGGASGINVEAGDLLICLDDGTPGGNQATVGSHWTIAQANLDGAIIGPAVAVDSDFAQFDTTTGKLIKDGGLSLDTNTSLGTSDSKIPSQKAVKTYADGKVDDTAYDPTTWDGDTTHAPSKNAVRDKFESLPAGISGSKGNFLFGVKRNAGVTTGKMAGYWTCLFAGTISAWNLTVDVGTVTVKIWKIATGTAHPTSANSINTSGISLSANTSIHSVDLSDFTTTSVAVGDIFAVEVTAVSGVFDFGGSVEITRT